MVIEKQFSLRSYNTFGLEVRASRYAAVRSEAELREILAVEPPHFFVLGGGSNLLLTQNLDALVLHNRIRGKRILAEEDDYALVEAGGGENWHDFVRWCIDQDLGGVENLSLIPGTVGAAPIQNIGAYGVELRDCFHHLEAIELATGAARVFHAEDCAFGYRDSIFKRCLKGRYFITRVILRLTRRFHQLNTRYGAIRETLSAMGITRPGIREISDAVIRIRQAKLPDPDRLGNAGSFFKNPEVDQNILENIRQGHPDVVFYPLDDGRYKIPAGWLIEQCGWKGYRAGDAGCYEKQALVLVNHGRATGEEIAALASRIAASVEETFGIRLTPEVNII